MDPLAPDRLTIHCLPRQRAANSERCGGAYQQQPMPKCALSKTLFAVGSLFIVMRRRVLIHDLHSLSKTRWFPVLAS
jgi:hypothetical protein